ncbi:MAG: hypothetical protein KIT08_00110 [Anaerolineales bacterium]|nr:MAG: hypothetical protein KIT08_00110 [Anaerolineales bacterium]
MYLTAAPFVIRSAPIEADDAYSYIAKATQMQTCFLQDCAALTTLNQQLTFETDDEELALTQIRVYHRLFVTYHPLHSILLSGLHDIGISNETAYASIAISMKLVLCLGLAYWLLNLLGRLPTALALFMLSPVTFAGTGLHTIVPSTMALALALWLWGLIASQHRLATKLFLPLSLAMMLFHQVGKLYAGAALGMYLLINFKVVASTKRQQLFILLTGAAIAIALLLPSLVTRPVLSFNPLAFYPYDWNMLANIIPANLSSLKIVIVWFSAFTFPVFGFLLLGNGIYQLHINKLHKVFATLITLTMLAALGVVYVVPWFGALMFERTWVALGILFTALVAFGIVCAAKLLASQIQAGLKSNSIFTRPPKLTSLAAGGALLLFCLAGITYPGFYLRHYSLTLENQISRQDLEFAPEPATEVLEQLSKETDLILYTHETPLYYFLTLGGLDHGAIYAPVVLNTPQEEYWLKERSVDIKYLVAANPMPAQGISVSSEVAIRAAREFEEFQVFVSNNEAEIPLLIHWGNNREPVTELIPANHQGWLAFSSPGSVISVSLRTEEPFNINGLRFDSADSTRWPWNNNVTITIFLENAESKFSISHSAIANSLPYELEVIEDSSSLIIAKVIAPKQQGE